MRLEADQGEPVLTLVHLLDSLNCDSSAKVKRQFCNIFKYCRLTVVKNWRNLKNRNNLANGHPETFSC